jgi:hypothetical protein
MELKACCEGAAVLHIMHEEFPGNVVAFSARGAVTGKDYEEVLLPAIKNRLRQYEKVSLLYVLGFEFQAFDVGVEWGETFLKTGYLADVERVAVVSDLEWIERGVKLMSIFVPCPVRLYGEEMFEEAKAWVCAPR